MMLGERGKWALLVYIGGYVLGLCGGGSEITDWR